MALRPAPALHACLLAAIAILALSPALASAQDYTMYEVQYMTPRTDAGEALNEALAEHNQTYHAGGPYHANVWYVANGPRSGQLVWTMGPVTFTQLDDRPAGEHDEDWLGNVVPHFEPEMDVSYWRRADGLSYLPNTDPHPIIRVRAYRIADGQMYRFNELRRQIKEVQEASGWPHRESVFRPRFRPEDGPDVVSVMAFDSWSDLDQMPNFGAAFREVHGQGAWQRFISEAQAVIDDSWDEYRVIMPELSGGGG